MSKKEKRDKDGKDCEEGYVMTKPPKLTTNHLLLFVNESKAIIINSNLL